MVFLFLYVKHVRTSMVDVQRESTALRIDTFHYLRKATKTPTTASLKVRTPASSDGVREETS